ncbi:SRPBCC domain-containing protein [Domibacillus sp. PGB-M46]|uniref:SRPBCC family protein n=1 Tax=Domibacillus sp. PGB-M46 TaxID=2910255 RepID=UPI001F59914F|nr:SRPBCC family protein [Domibacillus sp. PGB-M46]MCI2256513.1 SRPBCC domain-containing protein [Domibacillus sp. PGB-M46]
MILYKVEKVIDAPIERVFSYLSDDEKIKQWNSLFVENIYNSEEDKNACIPGTKYKSVSKVGKKQLAFDAELLTYNAPYSTTVKGYTKEGESYSKYVLTETNEGTLVILEASLIPKNYYYKIMVKLFGWVSKMMLDEEFDNLKELLEKK